MKFQSNSIHFLSRKCIWKCRLQNGVHFVSASMCKYISLSRYLLNSFTIKEHTNRYGVLIQYRGRWYNFPLCHQGVNGHAIDIAGRNIPSLARKRFTFWHWSVTHTSIRLGYSNAMYTRCHFAQVTSLCWTTLVNIGKSFINQPNQPNQNQKEPH